MARQDSSSAINAEVVPTVDYAPDPRGERMFRSLSAVLQRGISGRGTPAVIETSATWDGWAQAPQSFAGAAYLGAATRTLTASTSQLSDEVSQQLSDPALRLFAARMGRRS